MLRFKFHWLALLASLILTVSASCAENQNKQLSEIPASLEKVKTAEEAEAYIENVFSELYATIQTEEDEKKFKREYPPIAIATADKIIALAKNDKMLETGYGIKLFALNLSLQEKPENEAKIDALVDEITQIGKFPGLLIARRFLVFHKYQELDAKELSQEKFELIKEEAKALFLAEQEGYDE
ncbi:MAG: hypothetical protein LBJ67_18455, partial [Planctomycetaceae bacterium]|nr:hypothetical protein [Planctomycetaceae bacterium]